MNCLFCDKKVSDKAKYCSEAHRKAYQRRTQKGEQPGQKDPDNVTRTLDFKPTRTDVLFERSKPNYYKFSRLKNEKCIQCGKEFKTHLSLLRQCSPSCMRDMLDSLTV